MFWAPVLRFFLSTTLFINTILPMQQPSSFVEALADKQQTTVAAIVSSFENLNLEDGDFSHVPREIVKKIIYLIQCEYPWDEVIQLINMRTVCKRWLSLLSNTGDAIAKHFKVPLLHFAAMKNDVSEIMRLKMSHACSLLEPDSRGFRAAHYALATKAHHAIKLLKIGRALDTCRQSPKALMRFTPGNNPESLKTLYAQYDKECTVEELSELVKNGNMIELTDTLSRIENPSVIGDLSLCTPEELVTKTKPLIQLLRFALTSRLEYALFDAMDFDTNPSSDFFQLFKMCDANPNVCDELGRTALTQACYTPHLQQTLTALLTHQKIDVNLPTRMKEMLTPLHVATLSKNIQASQKLLELKDRDGTRRANVNPKDAYGNTPLHIAAESDNTFDLFDLLIKHGAGVNIQNDKNGEAPIHVAVKNGSIKILQALISNQTCNIEISDSDGRTPLWIASNFNQGDCIKALLKNGASIFCADIYGNTLLHTTASTGDIENMRKILPSLHRLINASNDHGFTPLHYAMGINSIACGELLLIKGAIVNAKTKHGDTPLHYAASRPNVQGIGLLVQYGACIDAKNNNELGRYTPLHCAVHRGNLQAAKILVELGANLQEKTVLGKTALEISYDFGHQELAKYLAEQMRPDTPDAGVYYQYIKNC